MQLGPPSELVFVVEKKTPTNQHCRVVFICCDGSFPFHWPSNPLSTLLHPARNSRRLNALECTNGLLAIPPGFGWDLSVEGLGRWWEGRREAGGFIFPGFFLVAGCVPPLKAQPYPVASPTCKFGSLPLSFQAQWWWWAPRVFSLAFFGFP